MPNWCQNKLKISGSEKDVAAVKALILNERQIVDFEVLLPVPSELVGYADIREWVMQEWGVKWNVGESYPLKEVEEDQVAWTFLTAWSAPTQWFHKVLNAVKALKGNNAEVTLEFVEVGMWFGGSMGIGSDGFAYENEWDDEQIETFIGSEDAENEGLSWSF